MKDFVKELKWRGMVQDSMPEVENILNSGVKRGYIGFDPTADSLHIGNMVQVMTLVHFQDCGHKPFILVGGATGLVGDPSGKSKERNLLDEDTLHYNLSCIKKQLECFVSFEGENSAIVVNNYDWFKNFDFLNFIRDVGKHITINYMMAKDSVKSRLESGLSFTEFSYQLIQGYDYFHLWKHFNVILQMGGSDQWGNIVTGTELIRRKGGGEAYAITTPLITKADGTKFGKSEGGNIWLDAKKTSPYKFYQYWLNTADTDAVNYIKIFSLKSQEEIESLIDGHLKAPHKRLLQNILADELTAKVHGTNALQSTIKASSILFGKSSKEELSTITEETLLQVFEGVPKTKCNKSTITHSENIVDLLTEHTYNLVFSSKGEARRMIKQGGVSINKAKLSDPNSSPQFEFLNGKYLLIQKGKKNYYLVICE